MEGGLRRRRARAWAWVYAAVFGPEGGRDTEDDRDAEEADADGPDERPRNGADGETRGGDR